MATIPSLPRASFRSFSHGFVTILPHSVASSTSRLLSTPLTTIHLTLPPLVSRIWDSILRAVPKKKTSHMKSRHRQMAGKALKDVTSLNRCPACGAVKRAHLLCPSCVEFLKLNMWKSASKTIMETTSKAKRAFFEEKKHINIP